MKIDTRFPTKLDTVSDAPEPLRSELVRSLPAREPVRLLVYVSSAEEPKETPSAPVPPKAVNPTETPSGPGNVYEFAEIITFVPRVRLADFQVSHQESGVLTLQLRASQGGEKLEITFRLITKTLY